MTLQVAIYARVSSEKQAQANTIDSQISALEERVNIDQFQLRDDNKFIDNGYSGAHLIRPELERMRDKAVSGDIDRIYVHSPDRLARKYAYQVILMEEFNRLAIEVVFLNCEIDDNPEAQLLLQMQGMISEYERAKIMERYRRGKIHAAKNGSVNVLGGAPYGYRYINKYEGGGEASIIIVDDEADVVRKIFHWVGRMRLSIGEVCRRLGEANYLTRFGKTCWDRSVVWGMLKNPIYMGKAAFGKTKIGKMLPRVRSQKHSSNQPKKGGSVYAVEKDKWIYISVSAIIDEALFDVVQQQLEENRKRARKKKCGVTYLLQGLLVCQHCHYAYYGKAVRNKRGKKVNSYAYYRCIGSDAYRFGGVRICSNKQIRTDTLEIAVWEEVKALLKKPTLILEEYQRRISEINNDDAEKSISILEKRIKKVELGVRRLIDSYTEGLIEKSEFEPRIKEMKRKITLIQDERVKIVESKSALKEMELIVTNLEDFAMQVNNNLERVDWTKKRDIIKTLVNCVEIGKEEVNVVFKINLVIRDGAPADGKNLNCLQHCCGSNNTALRYTFILIAHLKPSFNV